MSYSELKKYEDDLAAYIAATSGNKTLLPSNFEPNLHTIGAFDNFDHEEDTQSGRDGSHDTVWYWCKIKV